MPNVWEKYPEVELWLVGSNPPNHLKELGKKDKRIHVTGYVKNVGEILKTMTVMVCPWEGTYGFRSRMIELMALGLPIVTSPQTIDGMGLSDDEGFIFAKRLGNYSLHIFQLINDLDYNNRLGHKNKQMVSEYFDLNKTYFNLGNFLNRLAQKYKVI